MDMQCATDNRTLRDAVAHVVPFAAREGTHPILTGVQLLAEEGALRLVAADGLRLATDTAGAPGLKANAFNVVVPATWLRQLSDLLPAGSQTIMRVGGQRVTFEAGGTAMSVAPIGGKYPDYRLLLPRAIVAEAQLAREPLLSICGLLDPTHSQITFHLGRSDVVSLRDMEDGRAAQAGLAGVAAARTIKDGVDVTFNARYLGEALHSMTGPQVLLRSGGTRSSAVLTEIGHDSAFMHVLMPVAPPS